MAGHPPVGPVSHGPAATKEWHIRTVGINQLGIHPDHDGFWPVPAGRVCVAMARKTYIGISVIVRVRVLRVAQWPELAPFHRFRQWEGVSAEHVDVPETQWHGEGRVTLQRRDQPTWDTPGRTVLVDTGFGLLPFTWDDDEPALSIDISVNGIVNPNRMARTRSPQSVSRASPFWRTGHGYRAAAVRQPASGEGLVAPATRTPWRSSKRPT